MLHILRFINVISLIGKCMWIKKGGICTTLFPPCVMHICTDIFFRYIKKIYIKNYHFFRHINNSFTELFNKPSQTESPPPTTGCAVCKEFPIGFPRHIFIERYFVEIGTLCLSCPYPPFVWKHPHSLIQTRINLILCFRFSVLNFNNFSIFSKHAPHHILVHTSILSAGLHIEQSPAKHSHRNFHTLQAYQILFFLEMPSFIYPDIWKKTSNFHISIFIYVYQVVSMAAYYTKRILCTQNQTRQ